MLAATHLTYRYPHATHDAVRDVSLTIRPGEIVAVLGESGSGKSTLLSCVAGFLTPTEGRVLFDERDPRPGDIAVVMQNPHHQIVASSIERELAFALEARCTPRAEMVRVVDAALDALHWRHRASESPARLSAGECQRLVLRGTLLSGAPVLLLDEPTTMLDVPSREAFLREMRSVADAGRAILFITQFPEEACVADRVISMDAGRASEDGHYPSLQTEGRAMSGPMGVETGEVLLRLANATVDYQGRRVGGVNVTVREGQCVALVGPTGAGKTTTLLAAAGLLPLANGERFARDDLRIGTLLQYPERHFTESTVNKEVRAGGSVSAGEVRDIFRQLALPPHITERSPFLLSAGEQRRVALALQLLRKPHLLLLDEPTAGLDPRTASLVVSRLRDGLGARVAFLVATHDDRIVTGLSASVVRVGTCTSETRGDSTEGE